MFWRLLSDLGVWGDEGYLARKEARTTAHKRCEMIPRCVITVSMQIVHVVHCSSYMHMHMRWMGIQDMPQSMAYMYNTSHGYMTSHNYCKFYHCL
jgi:hypothetical protein